MGVIIIPHGFQNHYTIGFANGIASNGIEIALIGSDNIDSKKLLQNIKFYNLRGSHSKNRSSFKKSVNYLKYYLKLFLIIHRNRRSVLHLSGGVKYDIVEGIFINSFFKILSKRLIFTVHNILPHDNHTKLKKYIFKFIYFIPDNLIVHTSKMKEMLISQFNVSRKKIIIMAHGINDAIPTSFTSTKLCRKKLNIPTDKTVFLFFGNIAPYKGLDLLLDAFELMDNRFVLVVAGREKTTKYGKKISTALSSNENKHNIINKNMFIPDEEISLYFNAADAIVMPYRYIDQSGVVFLAWQFGLPIIAFDVGSLSDYVDEMSGVIVKGNSADDLMDALQKFAEKKDTYSRSIIKQKANKFIWNKVTKTILPLYR